MTDENNSITRLEEALGRLGAEHEPPKGWEDRVLSILDKVELDERSESAGGGDGFAGGAGVLPREINERSESAGGGDPGGPAAPQPSDVVPWPGTGGPERPEAQALAPPASVERAPEPAHAVVPVGSTAERRRRWLTVAAVDTLGMAAAGACIVLGLASPDLRPSGPAQLELAVNLESVGPRVRAGSGSAHVGDVVHASAAGGAGQRAIWVYHDEQLVLACPGAPDCRDAGDATAVDVVLRARGTYVILAVTSASALPVPRGSYDDDAGAAVAAKAITRTARIEAH